MSLNAPVWFSDLLFWSIQVVLLVAVAELLQRVLQIRQPHVLLFYWRALLVISFALPLLQPWHRPPAGAPVVFVPQGPIADTWPPPSMPVAARWHFPSIELIAPALGVLVLAGIAVRLVLFGLGLLKLRQFRRSSSALPPSAASAPVLESARTLVKARAEFRLSRRVDSPVTFGTSAPVILLPERFLSLDARCQSAIACHELLHVCRHDWALHLGEELLRSIFWFHPAIAWLIARVRLAREQVVDLEVVRLTSARKPYLEALLEFTNARAPIAAVPAPPFLAESQLVERVALMLKEVRMSRARLSASLIASSLCIALVIALAVWTFPLRAAPRPAQSADSAANSQNPILQRIQVKHHGFNAGVLSDAVVNAEQGRMEQLPGRLTVEQPFEQSKADQMTELLRDFWQERGLVVEVRSTLAPSLRPGYATLDFDVYKQTVLPGRLAGGVSGGVNGGVSGGAPGGLSSGVAGGVSGGVAGEVRTQASLAIPSVDYSTIWIDTVKRGPMIRRVRGLGTLVSEESSGNLIARITLPESMTQELLANQSATVQARDQSSAGLPLRLLPGHVLRVRPGPSSQAQIDIGLDGSRESLSTAGIQAGLQVDATIDIEKTENVLQIGRPAHAAENSTGLLFKIVNDGAEAERVTVKYGRSSVDTIEILNGLKEGDKVILSDVSSVENANRIRLTDEQHLLKH